MGQITSERLDLICPQCGTGVEITTRGILGGIIPQMFIHWAIDKMLKKDLVVTCTKCEHEFELPALGLE